MSMFKKKKAEDESLSHYGPSTGPGGHVLFTDLISTLGCCSACFPAVELVSKQGELLSYSSKTAWSFRQMGLCMTRVDTRDAYIVQLTCFQIICFHLESCFNGGECVKGRRCDCSRFNATGSRCQTIPNTGAERDSICRTWGQFHFETFDGLYYYFPGKATYDLVRQNDMDEQSFSIQVHNDPKCMASVYACERAVSLFFAGDGEIKLQGNNVTYKGQSVQLPHIVEHVHIQKIAGYVIVRHQYAFTLAWDGVSALYIKMTPDYLGKTSGLCGNNNAILQDDLMTSFVTVVTDHKPLLPILVGSSSKPPARIERWMLALLEYSVTLVYRPGANNAADYMSRHPGVGGGDGHDTCGEEADSYVRLVVEAATPNAMSLEELEAAAAEDECFRILKDTMHNGSWNSILGAVSGRTPEAKTALEQLWKVKEELSFSDSGLLLRGDRIVIPRSKRAYSMCNALLSHPFVLCHDYVSPFPFMASCTSDLCLSDGDNETWCRALTEYARACAQAGNPLHSWRMQFHQCAVHCDNDLIYNECINCCPVSCQQKKQCVDSELPCVDGCYCQEGLIYENGSCVTPSECPCDYHGITYISGSVVRDECNNCTCVGGKWICTELICPVECSVTGDIHFMTFDGRKYTFQASCQYILAKSLNTGRFTVTLRNVPCGQNQDGSCMQSVSLILNQDSRKQVTLTHLGDVLVYDHYKVNLPYTDDLFEIRQLSSIFLEVKTHTGIQIQYDREGLRLYLQVDGRWKDDTVGLCGTFNGNIQDDFLSPVGVPESTPELFGNAWKISSVCSAGPSPSPLDPCDVHLQSVSYATEGCSIITKEPFAPCHSYLSPVSYYEQCRRDTCKCGQTCLCSALAHYAHQCRRYGVTVDFRSQVADCAISCENSKEYTTCVDTCAQTCQTLSMPEPCDGECVEGCACPRGMYLNSKSDRCVQKNECPCYFQGIDYPPGQDIITSLGKCTCNEGIMNCESSSFVYDCPVGQIYINCSDPGANFELSRERTCENHLLNLTMSAHVPCLSGCVCPPGFVKHGDECFEPHACPCSWKAKEYFPGDVVNSSCHTCICQHGSFQCTFHPCPSMCTVYGDRHYRTFDGLAFDFVAACKVHLVKSTSANRFSVIVENVNCFNTGIICRKYISINVGDSTIKFEDDTGKPSVSSIINKQQNIHVWQAGFFTFVHFSKEHITILWDQRTTVHIQVGPQWQSKLTGLCGNFDFKTINEMKTPENFELTNSQEFGNSWTAVECVDSSDIRNPCSLNPLREPFAKKECSILFSEAFEACHPVVDVTWFYSNCLTDTCGCNRGGDCECFCTSVSAYAHQCCQHGITIDWRSPRVCPYDCEYFNKVLGKGPFKLVNYMDRQLVIEATSPGSSLLQVKAADFVQGDGVSFMLTPGLYKPKAHDLTLVSFEMADRPNFFLHVGLDSTLSVSKWEKSEAFQNRSTFIIHKNTWIARYKSFESFYKPGHFVRISSSSVYLAKYRHSDAFRLSTLFKLVDAKFKFSAYSTCEWRYEACAAACFKTCRDPLGQTCQTVPKVEGCIPLCQLNMVLDEVTGRCVYFEDCIEPAVFVPSLLPTVSTPAMYNITSTQPYVSVITFPGPTSIAKTESKVITTTVTAGPTPYTNLSSPRTASASTTVPLPSTHQVLLRSPSVTELSLPFSSLPTTVFTTNYTTAKSLTVVEPTTAETAHLMTGTPYTERQTSFQSFSHSTQGISAVTEPQATSTVTTHQVTMLTISTAAHKKFLSTELLITPATKDITTITEPVFTLGTQTITPATESPITTKREDTISTTEIPVTSRTLDLITHTESLTAVTTGPEMTETRSTKFGTETTPFIITKKVALSEISTTEATTAQFSEKSSYLPTETSFYSPTINHTEIAERGPITTSQTSLTLTNASITLFPTELFKPKSSKQPDTTRADTVSTLGGISITSFPYLTETLTSKETTSIAELPTPGLHTATSSSLISHAKSDSTQTVPQTEEVTTPSMNVTAPVVPTRKEVISQATKSEDVPSSSTAGSTGVSLVLMTSAATTEETLVIALKTTPTSSLKTTTPVSEVTREYLKTSLATESLSVVNVTQPASSAQTEQLVSSAAATEPPIGTPVPTYKTMVPFEVTEKHTSTKSTASPTLYTSIMLHKTTQQSILKTQRTSVVPKETTYFVTTVIPLSTKKEESLHTLFTTSSQLETSLNRSETTVVPFTSFPTESATQVTSQKLPTKMTTSSYSTYPVFTHPIFSTTPLAPEPILTTTILSEVLHTTEIVPTTATTQVQDTAGSSTKMATTVQPESKLTTSFSTSESTSQVLGITTLPGTVAPTSLKKVTTAFVTSFVEVHGTTLTPQTAPISTEKTVPGASQEKVLSSLLTSTAPHSTKISTTQFRPPTSLLSITTAPAKTLPAQEVSTVPSTVKHTDTSAAVSFTVEKQEFKNLTGIVKPTVAALQESSAISVTSAASPSQFSLVEEASSQTTLKTTTATVTTKVVTPSSTLSVTSSKTMTDASQPSEDTSPTTYVTDALRTTQATSEFSQFYSIAITSIPKTVYTSEPSTLKSSVSPILNETAIPTTVYVAEPSATSTATASFTLEKTIPTVAITSTQVLSKVPLLKTTIVPTGKPSDLTFSTTTPLGVLSPTGTGPRETATALSTRAVDTILVSTQETIFTKVPELFLTSSILSTELSKTTPSLIASETSEIAIRTALKTTSVHLLPVRAETTLGTRGTEKVSVSTKLTTLSTKSQRPATTVYQTAAISHTLPSEKLSTARSSAPTQTYTPIIRTSAKTTPREAFTTLESASTTQNFTVQLDTTASSKTTQKEAAVSAKIEKYLSTTEFENASLFVSEILQPFYSTYFTKLAVVSTKHSTTSIPAPYYPETGGVSTSSSTLAKSPAPKSPEPSTALTPLSSHISVATPSSLSDLTIVTRVDTSTSLPTKSYISSPTGLLNETTASEISEVTPVSLLVPTRETPTVQSCVPITENECIKHICVDGQLIQVNKSQNCPYNATQPSCGVLGFAVQINGDKCCPKWQCTCRCSIFSDLSFVTFDGNHMALFKEASYIVNQNQNETITIQVMECHNPNMGHLDSKMLCLAVLNLTHFSNEIIIDRLERKITVNSRFAWPTVQKYGYKIVDTGNMYLIDTPTNVKIQWFHSTGLIVVESNVTSKPLGTGLCGFCDGNSTNDLVLPNGNVLSPTDDPSPFLDSWLLPFTLKYEGKERHRDRNCSVMDCSECLMMLANQTFSSCHSHVQPELFCELWVRDAEYVRSPCTALSAYAAMCHKFNVCIEWRSPEYCPFPCPEHFIYRSCLTVCDVPRSCQSNELGFQAPDTCSVLTEGCVCGEGNLLHRTHTAHCIPEEKCACTDNYGIPRALGEIWKTSSSGCCMQKCVDNGTVVPVEYPCSDVQELECERYGEMAIIVHDNQTCCPRKICVCNRTMCENLVPECKSLEKLVTYYQEDSCCPNYTCECDPKKCELTEQIQNCREDQTLIAAHVEDTCCISYICACGACSDHIPKCQEGELLTVDGNATDKCCPVYQCVCEKHRCPELRCGLGMSLVEAWDPEKCCPARTCECDCDQIPKPECQLGEKLRLDEQLQNSSENVCNCQRYKCVRDKVCLSNEKGVLRPGQSIVEHTRDGLCYSSYCTSKIDPATKYHQLNVTSVNCGEKCQPNQVYEPPKDASTCCGRCRNVSCLHPMFNGTLASHKPGDSWISNCVRYDCTNTAVGPVLVASSVSCPPFNETECIKVGGYIVSFLEGCCKTCKEDGKFCKKVTVRMTIRKNDCRSNTPVNIVSCDGKCPSASIYNYNINTYARFCKCCRELGLQRRVVQLYCSGNSTWVNYSIQEPTDCSCQWS
ncbi:otogelin [Ambystoma mexicanum]|uniref:otogelin n=1 Tax=Ambystoma mexicanum TaxID=8296 RepID=UPI0037E8A67D